MKYTTAEITFREFLDEISLCINISGCKFMCPGCHSPELWEDVGTDLTQSELAKLIESNKGITLVGFMGGEPGVINTLAAYVKNNYPDLRVGWYWGGEIIPKSINLKWFDYIKVGPYIKELGPLDCPTTNQRMFSKGRYFAKIDADPNTLYYITERFWVQGKE